MHEHALIVHTGSNLIYLKEELDTDFSISESLLQFCDLIKSPENVSTFTITPYSLWTGAAKGVTFNQIKTFLDYHAENEIPDWYYSKIKKDLNNFGTLNLKIVNGKLRLEAKTTALINEIVNLSEISNKVIDNTDPYELAFHPRHRTEIKKILFRYHYFLNDYVQVAGEDFNLHFSRIDSKGNDLSLHDYQTDAVSSFLNNMDKTSGCGTIIMPPESGKTLVGIKLIEKLQKSTLIIVENRESIDRWVDELYDKTDLTIANLCIFKDNVSELRPITIGTYQDISSNLNLFKSFGFVIYDDCHKLPTDENEKTSMIESTYKLAMTSTLARADKNGDLVYALVGPKWYEILHHTLVRMGYQVPVTIYEVKVPLHPSIEEKYQKESQLNRRKIAGTNYGKYEYMSSLLNQFSNKRILLVSYYQETSANLTKYSNLKVINHEINIDSRKHLTELFNTKQINIIVCNSLMTEKISFKNVDVLIGTSYQMGSEREEYLRIGKVISSDGNKNHAELYSLVTKNTIEESDYRKRRKKLINYGFRYKIYEITMTERGAQ